MTIDQVEKELRIEREETSGPEFDASPNLHVATPLPTPLFTPDSIRYLWVRVTSLPNGAGEVSLGHAGQDAVLIKFDDPKFRAPNAYRFRPPFNWVHNCTASPHTGFAATLGCRKLVSDPMVWRPHPPPAKFPIEDEATPWGNGSKAVRFMVRASGRAFVRLTGLPSHVNYQVGFH